MINSDSTKMAATKLDARFFASTRGRVILQLRDSTMTVNELADAMGITDNAVRAHLLALERDGLVSQRGIIKGFRKPHYVYGLTDEARHLFPAAYDSLLNRLLSVLKRSLSPKVLLNTLRSVGRDIAADAGESGSSLDSRLGKALSTLEGLGGAAKVVRNEDSLRIESDGCPFADVVAEHPEVCKIAESVVGEIVGVQVTEKCDRSGLPRCRFEIDVA